MKHHPQPSGGARSAAMDAPEQVRFRQGGFAVRLHTEEGTEYAWSLAELVRRLEGAGQARGDVWITPKRG